MKSRVLLVVALLLGVVVVAQLALRDEPADVTALEPHGLPVTEGPGTLGEVEPLPPSAQRSDLAPSAPSAAEGPGDTTPRDASSLDTELPIVEILVVHDRRKTRDLPLPGVRVFLVEGASDSVNGRTLLGTTDARGRLRTELSTYPPPRLVADAETLPRGVGTTGPLKSSSGVQGFGQRGNAPPPEGIKTLTLRLPSAGALVVTARGPDGGPLPEAFVEVWSQSTRKYENGSWSRVGRAAKTDENGVAVLEDLRVGELCVAIDVRNTMSGPPPPPQRILLRPDAREQVTFEVGAGQGVLRGRVVEETGAPVAGIAVEARYDCRGPDAPMPQSAADLRPPARAGRTVTDAAGLFQLEGLGAGPYLLFFDLGPAMARLDERRLLPAPVVVRAVATAQSHAFVLAVDDVVVPPVELFVLRGQVVLDEDLLGEDAVTLRDLRPRIAGDLSAELARCDYDPRTGAFEVVCRLPLERLTLVLQSRRSSSAPVRLAYGRSVGANGHDATAESARRREFPFVPVAGVVLEDVELRYP